MADMNELGAVVVNVIPGVAGLVSSMREHSRVAADSFSAGFTERTEQSITASSARIGTAISTGVKTGTAEAAKALEGLEIAQRGVENQTRRLAMAEKDLAFARTSGYGTVEHYEEKLVIARQAHTAAVTTLTAAEQKHTEAVSAGAAATDKTSTAMRGAGAAASVMGSGIAAAATVAGAAFVGLTAAAGEFMHQAMEMGETWEGVERTLAVGTSSMGADLEGLADTVKTVASQTSASMGDIATATAQLAQRTGLRGSGLEQLTTDISDLGVMLGKPVDANAFTASLHAMGVPMQQADAYLNTLFNTARSAGVPFNSLVQAISKNGAALREFGVSAGPAAALLATFQANGIDTSAAMRGLTASAKEAAKEGKPLPEFLKDTVAQLQHFKDIGDDRSFNTVLERAFGPKGALAFKNAIDQGVLSVQSLSSAFDNIPTTKISDLYDQTKTLSDQWKIFHNDMDVALAPIGIALNQEIGGGLKSVTQWVSAHGDEVVGWFKAVADAAFNVAEFTAEFLGLLGVNTDGFRKHLMDMKASFDEHAESIKTNTRVLEDLNAAIDKTKDNKLVLKDNSDDVVKDLKKLGIEVKKMPGGELKITADSPENQKRVQDYLKRLTGKNVDVKVVPKPKTPEDKADYKGDDAHQLFPGSDKKIDVTISPHVDTQFIPDWLKKIWDIGTSGITDAFASDTPENRADPSNRLPSIHDDLPQVHQTPDAKLDNDRDAKRGATKDYAKAHGDKMPPGTAQWMDGKGPIPQELGPFYHPTKRQHGGPVPGTGRGDHVPILAEPGEFVLPRAVAANNPGLIGAMMSGAKGYQGGGLVGDGSLPSGPFGSPYAPKGVRENEEWQDRQTQAGRAVERTKDRIQDLGNSISDYASTIKDLTDQLNDPAVDPTEVPKLNKQLLRSQQQLERAVRDRTEAESDLTLDERKQLEAAQTPPGGGGTGSDNGISEDLGKGLVSGLFQGLGFPDVFGKSPVDWGITKIGTGALGWGLQQLLGSGGGSGGGGGFMGGLTGLGASYPSGASGGGAGGGLLQRLFPNLFPAAGTTGPSAVPPRGGISIGGGPPQYGPTTSTAPLAPLATPAPSQAVAAPPPSAPPDPLNPSNRNMAPAGYTGGGGVASQIYGAVRQAGYSHQTGLTAVAAAKYESGLDPTVQEKGGSDHWGLFQEQGNYPGAHGTAADQTAWFVNKLNSLGGPSVVDADPTNVISNDVEAGGYPGSNYDLGAASSLVGGDGGPSVQSAGYSVPNTAGGYAPQHYGLPKGTDIRQGAPGFPSWVTALGAKFGVVPSTYSGHQEGSGQNQGVDWFPAGATPDMSGASYSPEQTARLQTFASYLGEVMPGTDPQGQVIFDNRMTGQKTGVAMGQIVGPGTNQPQYYGKDWQDHFGHVHTRFNVSEPIPGIGGIPDAMQMVPPTSGTTPHYGTGASPGPAAGGSSSGGAGGWGAALGSLAGGVLGAISQGGADAYSAAQHMHDRTPEALTSQQGLDQESNAAWARSVQRQYPSPAASVNDSMIAKSRQPVPAPAQPVGNTTNFVMNPSGIMSPPEATNMMQNTYVQAARGASSAMSPGMF